MDALRVAVGQHSQAGCKRVNRISTAPRCPPSRSAAPRASPWRWPTASAAAPSAGGERRGGARLSRRLLWHERGPERAPRGAVRARRDQFRLHAQNQRGDARFDKERGYVCTFSALIFKGRDVHLLHVGDARVYRLHAQAWEQLSDDHRVRLSSRESHLGARSVWGRRSRRTIAAGPPRRARFTCWPATVPMNTSTTRMRGRRWPSTRRPRCRRREAGRHALARGSRDNATVQLVRVEALPDSDAAGLWRQRAELALPPPLQPRMEFEGYRIERELYASARCHVHRRATGGWRVHCAEDALGRPA